VHLLLESLQDVRRATLEEADQPGADQVVFVRVDRAGARARAQLAREVSVIRARLGGASLLQRAVAPREHPAQRPQRLAHLGCAGEWAEVARAVLGHATLQRRAGPALLLRDADVQEVLVVLELGVEWRLLVLD